MMLIWEFYETQTQKGILSKISELFSANASAVCVNDIVSKVNQFSSNSKELRNYLSQNYPRITQYYWTWNIQNKQTPWPLARKGTKPTERP
jgi:hypothetical protein